MTTTHRIKAGTEIKNRAEFERVLENIVIAQLTKERLENRRDKKIVDIRSEFEGEINDVAEKMQANVIRAEKYAETHRDELLPAKRKTAETAVTFFGFRTGNPTLVLLSRKWTWAKVLETIKELFPINDFIVTKESVDKDVIKARLSDRPEVLAQIGTRIEQKEVFFIDPKRDPADPQRLVAPQQKAA